MASKRILIVEDQFEIGLDLRSVLVHAGFEVIGPMATIEEAMQAIETYPLDAAILDANLNGCSVGPVAERLNRLGTRFLVVSGYSEPCLPFVLAGAPCLPKPYTSRALVAALDRLPGPNHCRFR